MQSYGVVVIPVFYKTALSLREVNQIKTEVKENGFSSREVVCKTLCLGCDTAVKATLDDTAC